MCQILCLTSHDPAQRDEIILRVWKQMSYTMKDGCGAAWISPTGEIGYHKRRYPKIGLGDDLPSFVNPKTAVASDFSESNDVPSDGGFLIIHGRAASNVINLENTHPMLEKNSAMIHNGVVKSYKYDNKRDGCTCDSELLLHAYLDGGIESVEKNIDGRYAFMNLQYEPPTQEVIDATPDGQVAVGKKTLHIAKDAISSLFCGVKSDKTVVIGTTEYLIELAGGEVCGEVKNHVLLIFTGKTEYTMTEYTPVLKTEKYIPPYVEPKPITVPLKKDMDHWWDRQEHQSTSKKFHYPSNLTLDAELEEEEKAEIERLEKEAVIGPIY